MTEAEVRVAGFKADAATSSTVQSSSHVADPHVDLDRVRRLVDDVQAAILANAEVIGRTEGEITIKVYPKVRGNNVKITLTIT